MSRRGVKIEDIVHTFIELSIELYTFGHVVNVAKCTGTEIPRLKK
jgi:hypothetical protein